MIDQLSSPNGEKFTVAVGTYDEISSAEVPGFTDALVKALPGLREHRCSIGERGGFVTCLRRGTYTPTEVLRGDGAAG